MYSTLQTLEYIQQPVTQNQQYSALEYNQPLIQNMQVDEIEYKKPLAIKNDYPDLYVCTLCTSYTKFSDYRELERHVERFHSDFKQIEKGSKRKRFYDYGRWKMKRIKFE